MLVKTLKYAGIGFLIGAFAGDIIAILTGVSDTGGISFTSKQLFNMAGRNVALSMILQSLFSGLYGALCFAGMSLYNIDSCPLALATAAHCAIIILPFIPIALLLGWFNSIASLMIMSCMQLAAFFIIWLIMYFIYKKQVNELNELVDKKREVNLNENKVQKNV